MMINLQKIFTSCSWKPFCKLGVLVLEHIKFQISPHT